MGKSVLPDASFASLSANSFPLVPAWAFTHLNRIFHSLVFISCTVCLVSSVRNVCMSVLISESSVVMLSVCTVTALSSSFV